jgi:hypothetical protein
MIYLRMSVISEEVEEEEEENIIRNHSAVKCNRNPQSLGRTHLLHLQILRMS